MSAHTPGPWLSHEVMAVVAGFAITSENGSLIARVSKGSEVSCKSNARLIAAAPDMFDVLQEFKIASDILDNNFDGDSWLKRVDAIMAKVTGQ